jgi:cell division protein FtsB
MIRRLIRGSLGDVFQLEAEVRWAVADRDAAAEQLEDENAKLRKVVADLSLDQEMLQGVLRRRL